MILKAQLNNGELIDIDIPSPLIDALVPEQLYDFVAREVAEKTEIALIPNGLYNLVIRKVDMSLYAQAVLKAETDIKFGEVK